MASVKPNIGDWYEDLEKGQLFKVVAVDDTSETVEVQNLDGDVEGMDMETWNTLQLEAVDAPEDWNDSFDDLEPDDFDDDEFPLRDEWSANLDDVDDYDR